MVIHSTSLNKDGDLTIQIIQNGDFAMKKTVDHGRMGISCGSFLVPVAAQSLLTTRGSG